MNTTHVLTPLVTHIPTGISIDELRGLVFYSAVDFSSGQGDGRIYFAPLSNPGAWFGWWNIVDCFSTTDHHITGLAVDAGNSAIFWTDGRNTYRATYTYTGTPSPGSVVITPGTCCMQLAPLGDPLMDLSIKWGGATSSEHVRERHLPRVPQRARAAQRAAARHHAAARPRPGPDRHPGLVPAATSAPAAVPARRCRCCAARCWSRSTRRW